MMIWVTTKNNQEFEARLACMGLIVDVYFMYSYVCTYVAAIISGSGLRRNSLTGRKSWFCAESEKR